MFGYLRNLIVVSVLADREKEGSYEMITNVKPQYESIDMSSESERLTQSYQTDGNITFSYSGGLTQSSIIGGYTQSSTRGGLIQPQRIGSLIRPSRSRHSVSSTEPPQPNGISIIIGS